MPKDRERRSYFRLDDVLLLHYRIIGNADGSRQAGAETAAAAPQVRTASILAQIDRDFGDALRQLWQAQPEIARALGLLNRKLSVLAQSMDSGAQAIPEYEETQVNISGGGIAFESEEALAPGTRLSLQLVLKPSQEELALLGKVVRCDALPEDVDSPADADGPRWHLRVDFEDSPDEQERLIQHIIQLQSIRISEARARTNP